MWRASCESCHRTVVVRMVEGFLVCSSCEAVPGLIETGWVQPANEVARNEPQLVHEVDCAVWLTFDEPCSCGAVTDDLQPVGLQLALW